jgi:hypothetical protein
MERTRTPHWLMAQGYRLSTIPPVVTWYATDQVSQARIILNVLPLNTDCEGYVYGYGLELLGMGIEVAVPDR